MHALLSPSSSQFFNPHAERRVLLALIHGSLEDQLTAAKVPQEHFYDPRYACWFEYLLNRRTSTNEKLLFENLQVEIVRDRKMDPEVAHDSMSELRAERVHFSLEQGIAVLVELHAKRVEQTRALVADTPLSALPSQPEVLATPDTPPVPDAPSPPVGPLPVPHAADAPLAADAPHAAVQEAPRVREIVSVIPQNPHAQEDPADPAFADFFAATGSDDSWDLDALDNQPEQQHASLWDGLLTPGHITLLHAQAKAGKSCLVFGLLQAMARGEEFLGRKTRRVPALYLTEESRYTLSQKARRFEFKQRRAMVRFLSRRNPRFASQPFSSMLSLSANVAQQRRAGLVVIDTLSAWQGQNNIEANAGLVEHAFGLIRKRLCDLNLAVLVLHHSAKHEGQARGSGALQGVVDTILHVQEPYENADRRILTVRNRLVESVQGLQIEYALREQGFTTELPATPEGAEGIWDFIPEGPPGVSATDLSKLSGMKLRTTRFQLQLLLQRGMLVAAGLGTKNEPYVYFKKNDGSKNEECPEKVLRGKGQAVVAKGVMTAMNPEIDANSLPPFFAPTPASI